MSGTGAADLGQLLSNRFAGTMKADIGIVRGCFLGIGEGFDGFSGQIYVLDGGAVIRFEGGKNFPNASASLLLKLQFVAFVPLGSYLIDDTRTGCILPIVIDDGVSENAVKPRDRTLFLTQFGFVLNGFEIRRLENVLRCCRVDDLAAQKLKKSVVHCRESGCAMAR